MASSRVNSNSVSLMICSVRTITQNVPGPNYAAFIFIDSGTVLGGQEYAYPIDYTLVTDEASLFSQIQAASVQAASDNSFPAITEWAVNGMPVGSLTPRSFSNPTLAVNTARQASTTRDALVIASVEIDAALSLTTGAKGTVSLQYADNNTFTTNLKTASVGVNGNTGTLVVGLNTVGAGGGPVVGIIPAGKYYRLFTTNVTGTPTFGTPSIQEVLL